MRVRAYISTVWGCPYEGETDPARALEIARELLGLGLNGVQHGRLLEHLGVGLDRAPQPDEVARVLMCGFVLVELEPVAGIWDGPRVRRQRRELGRPGEDDDGGHDRLECGEAGLSGEHAEGHRQHEADHGVGHSESDAGPERLPHPANLGEGGDTAQEFPASETC